MISQFRNRNYDKEQKDFGVFTVVALLTKITRAKKKWYFIKVEDFSDSVEFFVKDPLDLEEFDLLIISWYRGKGSPRRKKIIKANLERLTQVATDAGKFDPEETVFEVKKRRLGITNVVPEIKSSGFKTQSEWSDPDDLWLEVVDTTMLDEQQLDKKLLSSLGISPSTDEVVVEWAEELWDLEMEKELEDGISYDSQDSSPNQLSDYLENPSKNEHNDEDSEEQWDIGHNEWVEEISMKGLFAFDLPNDIQTIKKLQTLIKMYPWDTELHIGSMKVYASDFAVEEIRILLNNLK